MILSRRVAQAGAAALCGALGALGQAPFGFWPLTLLALAAAFALAARAASGARALVLGWAFGTGYFALALAWIVEPFLVEPEIHGWMAPFALVFMAAGLALFWAAAFRAAFALGGGLVAAWALAELARAYVLTGFPWAGFAQIWVGQGIDQSLAFIGPQGLGLVTLALGWALWRLADAPGLSPVRLALAVALLALPAGLGPLIQRSLPAPQTAGPVVRLIQPNVPQDQKWDPILAPVFFARLLDFTAAGRGSGAGSAPRPDLILLPETAIPGVLEYAEEALIALDEAAQGATLVAGIQRLEGSRIYNSAIVLAGGVTPTAIYDKHHLVPFGEYIPFGDLAARFGLYGFAARDGQGFSAGPGPQVVDLPGIGGALPLICYEAVFPQFAQARGARPALLVQLTNDAWFGEWSGPYQHLAQARMRAIEQGVPMLRAANTGVSAAIDAQGRIAGQIALGQAGYLDVPLPRPTGVPTLYARTGDAPWAALILLAFAVRAGLRLRRGPPKSD